MKRIRHFMVAVLILLLTDFCIAVTAVGAVHDPLVYRAQTAMKEAGYNPGMLDGIWGRETQRAIREFQHDVGLPVTGELDLATRVRLGIRSPARGFKTGGQIRERRLALVIGNGAYKSAPLANPTNDARDIAGVLRGLDFVVIEKINADERQMVTAIDSFYNRLGRSDLGLFYFAGHGMQIKGSNYLIPVDAHVISETDVEFEAVDAGRVLGKMKSAGNKLNIVILDACRDNPFQRSFRTENRGLAHMDAPKGTIIAYATSPGSVAADGVGRNGIYTKHLLKHIKRPDLSVQEVFMETGLGVMSETADKQVPWVFSTPIPRYYLASSGVLVDKSAQSRREQTLTVKSNIGAARVFVDGRLRGQTPLANVAITAGYYTVRVEKDGYGPYLKRIRIEAGRSVSLYAHLSPAPLPRSRLYVDAEPENAAVRLKNGPEFFQGIELDEGRYELEVAAYEYEAQALWVTLRPGEDTTVDVILKRTAGSKKFADPLGMEFALIPAGIFMMGSELSPGEVARKYGGKAEWYEDEHPRHQVRISRPFYLQTTEVTVGQWRSFVRETGYKTEAETGGGAWVHTGSKWGKKKSTYWDDPGFEQSDSQPVTCVSWNDVQKFIQWLNSRNGSRQYRLPTEAEWEYAARAGSGSAYSFGRNEAQLSAYAWYRENSGAKTHAIGGKKPNAWGLYDMHGNVWEWCQDRYGDYPTGFVSDPRGPSSGSIRLFRGGSWGSGARRCRAAFRFRLQPDFRYRRLGFRLLRME